MNQQPSLLQGLTFQLKAYKLAFKQAPMQALALQLPFILTGGLSLLLAAAALAAGALSAGLVLAVFAGSGFAIGHFFTQTTMAKNADAESPLNLHLRQDPLVQKMLARKIDKLPEYQRPLAWQNIQNTLGQANYSRANSQALKAFVVMTGAAATTMVASGAIIASLPFIMLAAPTAWLAIKANKKRRETLQDAANQVQTMLDKEKTAQEKIRQAELEQLAAKAAAAPAATITLAPKPRVRTIGDITKGNGIKPPPATPQ